MNEPITEQKVKMRYLRDIKREPVDWCFFPYIAFGKLTLVVGNGSVGKTMFALWLAARLSQGQPLVGENEAKPPMTVIIQTDDDNWSDTIAPRLDVFGADGNRIAHICDDEGDARVTLSDARIREAIVQENARVLIIDPLVGFLDDDSDMNHAGSMRRVFTRLRKIAEETNCAVIVISHYNKGNGKSHQRIQGSSDIRNVMRNVLTIDKYENDRGKSVLRHEKSNLGAPGASLLFEIAGDGDLIWHGEVDEDDEPFENMIKYAGDAAMTGAKLFLMNTLSGAPMDKREVIKAAAEQGIKDMTLRRAREELNVVVNARGNRSDWSLPQLPEE